MIIFLTLTCISMLALVRLHKNVFISDQVSFFYFLWIIILLSHWSRVEMYGELTFTTSLCILVMLLSHFGGVMLAGGFRVTNKRFPRPVSGRLLEPTLSLCGWPSFLPLLIALEDLYQRWLWSHRVLFAHHCAKRPR